MSQTRKKSPPAAAPSGGGLLLWGAVGLFLVALGLAWAFLGGPEPERKKSGQAPPTKGPALHPWTQALKTLAEEGLIRGRAPTWQPEPWRPLGAVDEVVDRFVLLKRAASPKANDLLGGRALEEGEKVDETAFPVRATDTYLRGELSVQAIYRGEPDGKGGQAPAPGRYTLVCKGLVKTPAVQLRDARGELASSNEFITNPELVVEVRQGKVFGVRATTAR